MKFTKMHGIGNCYIFVDCFDEPTAASPLLADRPALARAISDRNTGVGSDGLVLMLPCPQADARMEMYNLDGSRGQMCGNAVRCVARYLYEHGLARRPRLRILTDAGSLDLELLLIDGRVDAVRVDMGVPRLRPEDLPVRLRSDQMKDLQVRVLGRPARMTCVSMGNPHAVIHEVPLECLTPAVLAEEGRRFETDPMFPERTNVHFVRINRPDDITMLTWERGSGATAACGTGASAACVAGVLTGRNARRVTVHLPGGDLRIEWREDDGHVFMTGPAAEIFTGDWPER